MAECNVEGQDGVVQDGADCLPFCFQPQLIYGTCIALPPIFCMIDCDRHKSTKIRQPENMADDDEEDEDVENDKRNENKLKQNGFHDFFVQMTQEINEKPKPEERDKRCPLKQGSFSFPAKNAMYHPRQTLENTVLELYKKKSYPYDYSKMKKC